MGRSGGRSGGSRSGGGRSGGSRSSGRSASRSFSGSSSRSVSSSASRSFSSNRSAVSSSSRSIGSRSSSSGGFSTSVKRPASSPKGGRPMSGYVPHKSMGGYEPRKTVRKPIHTTTYRGGFGGGLFGGRNIIINVDNHQESHTETPTAAPAQQTVYETKMPNLEPEEKKSKFTSILTVIIWVLIIYLFFSLVSGGSNDGITQSTVNREKLHVKINEEAGYYTDECGWIRNRTTLENGLESFYDSTGIMPYVYIIDNVNGDYDPSTEKLEAFAEEQYEALFDDEGHALLLFWDYGGAYEYVLMLGYDTQELMDTEACDILFDYLDYYYYYADTEEEFFADAFEDAGKRMMTVTRSGAYYVGWILIWGIVIFAIYRWWKSRKDKEEARKKRAEEILNSPLEKFGESGDVIDELEKKYEKEI